MMQSARFLEISIILAMQPLDGVQYAARNMSLPLLVNNGMIEEAEKGLDWIRAAVQFSHVCVVAKKFTFCTTWIAVQAPVKFKVLASAVILFKAAVKAVLAVMAS